MDLISTPFSRFGAVVAVCRKSATEPLVIHHAYRKTGQDELFGLAFTRDGSEIPVQVEVRPEVLLVTAAGGKARVVIADDHTLVIDSDSLGCKLAFRPSYGYGVSEGQGRHKVLVYPLNLHLTVDALRGNGSGHGPMEERPGNILRDRQCDFTFEPGADGLQVRIGADLNEQRPDRSVAPVSVDAVMSAARAEWEAFERQWPAPPAEYAASARWSRYNLWACFVRAQGNYVHDAIIMSRRFMCAVWSWDHCFNAMAIALADGTRALEQWLLPFEVKSPTGVLPDDMLPFAEPQFGVTKPPVHGWALDFLLDHHTYPRETLQHVREKLSAWTNWWITYRDADRDGLFEYPLALDSGWDNTTMLEPGFFLAAPDLNAYLVLQMRTLARLSTMLDDAPAASRWNKDADALLARMLERLWTGKTFTAVHAHNGKQVATVSSLMSVMPLVLGADLPQQYRQALVRQLREIFLTDYGIATEDPKGPFYVPDSYWTGPIWAPTMMLLVDGLSRGGEKELAREVAARFCNMVEHTAKGLFENFDALTGKGLRASGYTWTSAVHLLLLNEYVGK